MTELAEENKEFSRVKIMALVPFSKTLELPSVEDILRSPLFVIKLELLYDICPEI